MELKWRKEKSGRSEWDAYLVPNHRHRWYQKFVQDTLVKEIGEEEEKVPGTDHHRNPDGIQSLLSLHQPQSWLFLLPWNYAVPIATIQFQLQPHQRPQIRWTKTNPLSLGVIITSNHLLFRQLLSKPF